MPELARFQDALALALSGGDELEGYASRGLATGLRVYRNTVAKGCLDALAANYPTVQRLVGEAWFAACARAYRVASPPTTPILATYGASFPDFLDGFEPARALPYLASVARIDRLWTESHLAADAAALLASDLNRRPAAALATETFDLHPATRFARFDEPAPTIWTLNRPPAPVPDAAGWTIDWRGEGVVLTRPRGKVHALVIGGGGIAFLAAAADGATFAQCAAAADAAEPECSAGELFADLVGIGAFARR